MVGKVYAGILIDRVRKVTKGLIHDEQWGLSEGRRFVECMWVLGSWGRYIIGLGWGILGSVGGGAGVRSGP